MICLTLWSVFTFLFSNGMTAQEVSGSVDRNSIRIGEQILYNIEVETGVEDLVVFPEGETFSPLEVLESLPIDTSSLNGRLRLLKEYAITQFDSGSYTIPPQRVIINDQNYFTDSIPVEVNNVVVDTTKQKLYPIKPPVEVPSAFNFPVWAWWLLGFLLLSALVFYFFLRRKRKEAAAQMLPPYEQAIFELQKLDESHLLEKHEIKEYYSQLSMAVRRYLDGEVYDHAMESTTGELIAYLEAERTSGKLNLQDSTIEKLKRTLERADLAKFANTKPDVLTAREDRGNVELVINDTRAAKPEPTEEELMADMEYQRRLDTKRKRRKIAYAVLGLVLVAGAFTGYVISTSGFTYFKDTYIGHPTKSLLEKEWIRSDYGTPPVVISTPVVLRRTTGTAGEPQPIFEGAESFTSGSLTGNYYVEVSTRQLAAGEFDPQAALEQVLEQMEARGIRNMLTKQEEFETVNGAKGLKIFGRLDVEEPESGRLISKDYVVLNFTEGAGFQQVVLIYDEEDTYADEVTERILGSVELRNIEN